MYQATTATRKIARLRKRIRAVAGGTSASKTISILLCLIDLATTDTKPTVTHVVSESLPHLKLAAMADFLKIMKEHGYYQDSRWDRTNFVYTFETGSTFQFFGVESPEKVHGPRRDRLFVNEANNVPYVSFDQLEVRTNDIVFLDWNPSSEYWFYTEVLPYRKDDLDFITLTYKDNEALPESIVKSIESRRDKKGWWQVYGLGQLGEAETRIYTGWKIIDEIPHEARLERRGLDFGFTNDPTAIVDIHRYNGGYILDEQLYQKGMLNKPIADFLLNLPDPSTMVKADSAEPKSIEEISSYGVNILGAQKGADSVRSSITKVQEQQISVTSRSINLIKEYRNYLWETDRNGKILNVPEDGWDHCLDAARYGFDGLEDSSVIERELVQLRSMQERAMAGLL